MIDEQRWNGMSVEFRLDEATVVAVFEDSSLIHETGLALTVQDGRLASYYGSSDDPDQDRATLEYHCIINPVGARPDQVRSREARINVDGIHENGQRLTIKGNGWAGHDQDGHLELLFDDPPVMVIYDYDDEEDDDVAGGSDNVVRIR